VAGLSGGRGSPESALEESSDPPQAEKPSGSLFLHLAVDAVPGMRERVEPLESHRSAAGVAAPKLLGIVVEPPERFLDAVEIASFLGCEEGSLLALHRLGPLIGHMIGVGRKIGVLGLAVRLGHLVEETQRAKNSRSLLQEALLNVRQLCLVHGRYVPARETRSGGEGNLLQTAPVPTANKQMKVSRCGPGVHSVDRACSVRQGGLPRRNYLR